MQNLTLKKHPHPPFSVNACDVIFDQGDFSAQLEDNLQNIFEDKELLFFCWVFNSALAGTPPQPR